MQEWGNNLEAAQDLAVKPHVVLPPNQRWTAAQLLEKFSIEDNFQNVFVVGCCSGRINIFAQQQRALNLVWALHDSGRLAGSRVIIIGAGFAGVTAATALKALGHIEFELVDRNGQALHLQRGNLTRFIQPFMYDWPVNGCGYPRTELPYLNWWSSEAGDVCTTILRQWARLRIDVVKRAARRIKSGAPATVMWDDGTYQSAEIVILATGIGIEIGVKSGELSSYWSNDSLAQSHLGKKVPATVLVSGSGDGGLIDVIRACLLDFNHKQFIKEYISRDLHDAFTNSWTQGQQGELNWHQIDFPIQLMNRLRQHERKDTQVIFNASEDWFLSRSSSVFNRLIVAALLQLQPRVLTFVAGKLLFHKHFGGKWNVLIQKKNAFFCVERVDHLVLRHGTAQECPNLFYSNVWKRTTQKWITERQDPSTDATVLSHYPDWFLLDRFMRTRGEAEYEVVFRRDTEDQVRELLETLKADSNNSKRVHGRSWIENGMFFLQVRTTSRENLHSFMDHNQIPYCQFGIKIPKKRIFEMGTEINPFVFYVFPGSAIRLLFSIRDREYYWCYVRQQLEGHPLRDAHNLIDADTVLQIVRKQWTLEKMISLGWRMTATSAENWRSYFDHN